MKSECQPTQPMRRIEDPTGRLFGMMSADQKMVEIKHKDCIGTLRLENGKIEVYFDR